MQTCLAMLLLSISALGQADEICSVTADTWMMQHVPDKTRAQAVCQRAVAFSILMDLCPYKVAATLFEESRFDPDAKNGNASARGELQVKVFWCKGRTFKGCHLTLAGLQALKLLRTCAHKDWENLTCKKQFRRPKSWRYTLCHYNDGNVCASEYQDYVNNIVRNAAFIRGRHKNRSPYCQSQWLDQQHLSQSQRA